MAKSLARILIVSSDGMKTILLLGNNPVAFEFLEV
jgi:hypothetical protein